MPAPATRHQPLLSVADIADRLKLSEKTMPSRWIERGDLPAHHLGRTVASPKTTSRSIFHKHRA